MELQPDDNPVIYTIQKLENTHLTIDGSSLALPLLLSHKDYLSTPVDSPSLIKTEQLDVWIDSYKPELIIIGMGSHHQPLHTSLMTHCHEKRVGFETMTPVSACHTHRILMSERRPFVMLVYSDI